MWSLWIIIWCGHILFNVIKTVALLLASKQTTEVWPYTYDTFVIFADNLRTVRVCYLTVR